MRVPIRMSMLGVCLGLAGCAITVDVPANRFDSPETLGKQWRVKVQGDYGGENSVVLTPYHSNSPPNTTDPQFTTTRFVRASGGVEVLERLDVEIRTLASVQAKYQFLGEPRLTAVQGNVSLAVTACMGASGSKDTFTPLFSGQTVRNDQSEYYVDSAFIAGYRVLDPLLFYGGPFVRYTDFSGTFETITTSSGASSGAQRYSGTVLTTGGNLGLEVGTKLFQIKGEVAYANVKSGNLNTGRAYAGISIAFQFGKQ